MYNKHKAQFHKATFEEFSQSEVNPDPFGLGKDGYFDYLNVCASDEQWNSWRLMQPGRDLIAQHYHIADYTGEPMFLLVQRTSNRYPKVVELYVDENGYLIDSSNGGKIVARIDSKLPASYKEVGTTDLTFKAHVEVNG